MNLLLIDAAEVAAESRVVLDGRRARHLIDVLRAEVGARVRTGIVDGAIGQATVLAVDTGSITLDLGEVVTAAPPPAPPAVDVILALPRPKALSRTVQTLAAMAVGRIDLVNAWRVDASYFDSPRLDPSALAADVRLGAEQGATTRLPEVAIRRLLVPYLDEVLAPRLALARASGAVTCLVAHPRDGIAIEAAVSAGDRAPVVLAIGPEGGWIDRELDSFAAAGFHRITLGAAVLRTENAIAAALAQLELLRRLPRR